MSTGRFVWHDLVTPDVEGAKAFSMPAPMRSTPSVANPAIRTNVREYDG